MSTKPTSTPWRVFNEDGLVEIHDAHGEPVVFWQGFDRSERSRAKHLANARFIVKAVNAYGARPVEAQSRDEVIALAKAAGIEDVFGDGSRWQSDETYSVGIEALTRLVSLARGVPAVTPSSQQGGDSDGR